MTDQQRAAMQAELEALENNAGELRVEGACNILRGALAEVSINGNCIENAEQQQEPVAWTHVGEAMPKSGVVVLACYRNRLGNLRRIRAHWIAAKTEEVDGDFDYGEYDEAADTYWTPEGWYECIDNWADYSSVAVCEGEVTHWMPLPPEPGKTPPRREWQGLTRLEILKLANEAAPPDDILWARDPDQCVVIIGRYVEQALKEKNGE